MEYIYIYILTRLLAFLISAPQTAITRCQFSHLYQAQLIKELYEGEMRDFVKCKVCDYESSRIDKFLDVPLVLRAFGAQKAVSSVEEAFEKFIETELLEVRSR